MKFYSDKIICLSFNTGRRIDLNQKKLFVRFALIVLLIIFSSKSGQSQSVKSDTNYKLLRSDKGGVQIVFTPKIDGIKIIFSFIFVFKKS